MPIIRYGGEAYRLVEHETVLDGLTRHGVTVPCSCRAGVCQTCLMRAVEGTPPVAGQKGLKDSQQAQGYFLACASVPETDLTVAAADEAGGTVAATVVSLTRFNEGVMRVRLVPEKPYPYHAGQFLNCHGPDGLVRSYSIASLPGEEWLELHVQRVAGGRMSGWVHDSLRPGMDVRISEAHGDCYYRPGKPDQPLLLIATGTGLAPLYGILRDALSQGHQGPVWLFHGSSSANGLYLMDKLWDLSVTSGNVHYRPCVSRGQPPEGLLAGRANELALSQLPDLKGWRVFLCGHPDMVAATKKKAFLAGAGLSDIYADPFTPAA